MIFRGLVVGALGTNCYIFGSDQTKEVVIIDPGGNAEEIIKLVEEIDVKPIAVLLTHGHFDHTTKVGNIKRYFNIPLMFSKKEYDSGTFSQKKADRWLIEGDTIIIGELTMHVLETPGHSPGSISFYCSDVKEFNGKSIDGVLFTGDLLFRGSIGRSDFGGGDPQLLFSSIKEKIMYNKDLTDNFLIFPGHMGMSTIGVERAQNMFRQYFL
jgi:glyoxylase-like metal-dependent hydrolase (beta-lactamase superfamily II)